MTRRDRVECRTILVDGQPVVVRGRGEPSPEAVAAITEVARAAQAAAAELPDRCYDRTGSILPCLREPEHEPPHRNGRGREW